MSGFLTCIGASDRRCGPHLGSVTGAASGTEFGLFVLALVGGGPLTVLLGLYIVERVAERRRIRRYREDDVKVNVMG